MASLPGLRTDMTDGEMDFLNLFFERAERWPAPVVRVHTVVRMADEGPRDCLPHLGSAQSIDESMPERVKRRPRRSKFNLA